MPTVRKMPGAGRGTKYDEPLSERLAVNVTPTQLAELKATVGTGDITAYVRESALERLNGKLIRPSDVGTDSVSLPILQRVPCGPLQEAFTDNPSRMTLNGDWKREFRVIDEDFFVYADGQSMEGAHITDGALLLIERLPAHRRAPEGKPAFIQVTSQDGAVECTIKYWHTKDGKPFLKDGNGKEFKLGRPEKVEVIGIVKRAILEF